MNNNKHKTDIKCPVCGADSKFIPPPREKKDENNKLNVIFDCVCPNGHKFEYKFINK